LLCNQSNEIKIYVNAHGHLLAAATTTTTFPLVERLVAFNILDVITLLPVCM
jgi:hypothetical protein